MPPIRKAVTRFSPWLTIVAVYLVLGLAGRTLLWARFGIEADVGASRLLYILPINRFRWRSRFRLKAAVTPSASS